MFEGKEGRGVTRGCCRLVLMVSTDAEKEACLREGGGLQNRSSSSYEVITSRATLRLASKAMASIMLQ